MMIFKKIISNIENSGFTMIEMVLTIVIIGILISVAVQQISPMTDTFKYEETRAEMDRLAYAMIGDADVNAKSAHYFGYVGDIGAMPPNLDALAANTESYSTWAGPYINSDFEQDSNDYKIDAWRADYIYSGGASITSVGSGNNIVRRLAASVDDLLYNRVTGNIYDLNGTPPGNIYCDSLSLYLTVPDGSGGLSVRPAIIDAGGYFSYDSIPIGLHNINIVYRPTDDTIRRSASVYPNSDVYSTIYLISDYWPVGGFSEYLTKLPGSDSLTADCHGFYFRIANNTADPVTVDSVLISWSAPEAYYRYIRWDGIIVFDRNNPKAASGETVDLDNPQTILPGENIIIEIDFFKSNPTGGSDIELNNIDFSVTFSDGSVMTVSTGSCP
jgi:prepilin-type N-terminal cleavage/methylation domain-containing protein